MKQLLLILTALTLAACAKPTPGPDGKTESIGSIEGKAWSCPYTGSIPNELNCSHVAWGKNMVVNWNDCVTNYNVQGNQGAGIINFDDVKGCLNGPQTWSYKVSADNILTMCSNGTCMECI